MSDRPITRIVIADDHHMTLVGLAATLSSVEDFEVVGEASDGESALGLTRSLAPDVLVVDVEMPNISGVGVARTLRSSGMDVKILALSAYDEPQYVYGLMDAGASGYLMKEEADRSMMVAAVWGILDEDDFWVSPGLARRMIGSRVANDAKVQESLSDREFEVLLLIADGLDNLQIAEALFISENTVKNHLKHIKKKLDVKTRAEVIAWAWHKRLIRPGSRVAASTDDGGLADAGGPPAE